MEMSGEYRIPATRDKVWAALNDPEILKSCIPGCETLEMQSPTEMTAKVVAKIGPVKASFTGKVHLQNMNPPESYTISGEGQGGVAGFAKGGADVKLTEDGAVTILAYQARAQIGGKLAQLGSRLIDSTAKMMADQFFSKFTQVVGDQSAADAAALGVAPAAIETAPAAAAAEPDLSSIAANVGEAIEALGHGAAVAAAKVSEVAGSAAKSLDQSAAPAARHAAEATRKAERAVEQVAKKTGVPQWIWVIGAIVVLVILIRAVS